MLHTVQVENGSLGRDLLLNTVQGERHVGDRSYVTFSARGKFTVGREVMLQKVHGGMCRSGDVMLQSVQRERGRSGET